MSRKPPQSPKLLPSRGADGRRSYFVHRLPSTLKPAQHLTLTIQDGDRDATVIEFGEVLKPRHPNKHQPRKQRYAEVRMDFGCPVHITQARMRLDTSVVECIGRRDSPIIIADGPITPRSAELSTYFERTQKRKVLNAFYYFDKEPPASCTQALNRYDRFYCCDVNTWSFRDVGPVSAWAAIRARSATLTDECSFAESDIMRSAVVPGHLEGNPERHLLRAVADHVMRELGSPPARPIGIITDSDLGLIRDMNLRTVPLIGDYFLPPGFEVAYATADAGTDEFMCNRLVQMCDAECTRLLQEHQKRHRLERVF